MALDTKEKRAAAIGVARPWMRGKLPSATPDQEWRISSGNAYGGNALSPSGSTATIYPNGDGSIGDWTDETGVDTTDLWSHVDEPVASANDTDYIQCATASAISNVFLLLEDMPGDFSSMNSTIVVKFRGRRLAGEFGPVQIFQSDETTALTDTFTPTTTGTAANYTITLNVTGSTSKSAWDGARLKFATNSDASCWVQVTAIQVDITYNGVPASGPGYGTNQNASILLAM